MAVILYLFVFVGWWQLARDLRGGIWAAPQRVGRRRLVGVAAGAGLGLSPLIAWQTGRLDVGWPFQFIAYAYLIAAATFVIGAWILPEGAAALTLRRAGYIALLILATLPSWVLILLGPLAALAGVALVRPSPATADEAEETGPSPSL